MKTPEHHPGDGGGPYEKWWQSTFWMLYMAQKIGVMFALTWLVLWTLGVRA